MRVRFSLLLRMYLATAVALTVLFAVSVWFFQRQAADTLRTSVEEEVRRNLRGVDALWRSRAELLSTVSALFASMSDVRSAFGTRDLTTIRDTAGEMWARAAAGHPGTESAAFVVADPHGVIQASVGRVSPPALAVGQQLPAALLEPAHGRFPNQTDSFALWDQEVWQVILTPVYVSSGGANALLNILLAAHPIRQQTLRDLQTGTGGDFLLRVGERTVLSTLPPAESEMAVANPGKFAIRTTDLQDLSGGRVGQLWAVRSFRGVEARTEALRRSILAAWLVAMAAGLALSYILARRIVEPLRALNAAAQEIGRENYTVRVPEDSKDELGVLARTFNGMAASIESARVERIRREQINAIGRLAASIAHDLRNPLSAILGGAEMLAEFELPPDQSKQTAVHIQNAAKRMQNLLAEVSQVAKTKPGERTRCDLAALVNGAVASQAAKAEAQKVHIHAMAPEGAEVLAAKSRLERVLVNLLVNALEVMPNGGDIYIVIGRRDSSATVEVRDTGPGIPAEIRDQMFQPFVTAGKRNGLGLGLALARQTLLDHEGDLELLPSEKGARFLMHLPLA